MGSSKKSKPTWYLYIILCGDGTLYTGITTDIEQRVSAHECGKGAKYTRGRGPLKLVYKEMHKNRSKASQREAAIKRMNKTEKLELIKMNGTKIVREI